MNLRAGTQYAKTPKFLGETINTAIGTQSYNIHVIANNAEPQPSQPESFRVA